MMQSKVRFRTLLLGVVCSSSALLGVVAFALPHDIVFPPGTENCKQFIRGGAIDDQTSCIVCCKGTEDAYKANIGPCIDLCKKYSDLPEGQKAVSVPTIPAKAQAQPNKSGRATTASKTGASKSVKSAPQNGKKPSSKSKPSQ